MNFRSAAVWVLLASPVFPASSAAHGAKPDAPGCADHPLFPTRMSGYRIESCETKAFGTYQLPSSKRGPRTTVEGKVTHITYRVDDPKDDQSGVAVTRNYGSAVVQAGGKVVDSDPNNWVVGTIVADGKEAWTHIQRGNGKIWLHVVEKKAMEQQIVADAAAFGKDLDATGHVAVYGIYFDTGKSVLKPESTPALQEVAKLLAADAALKLWVVGHTDSVGQVEGNMKLAQARAEAVVAALTGSHGVASVRLKGYGVGPLAPVATNSSEEGRAKNRRVELVRQ